MSLVKEILAKVEKLPAIPAVVQQVLALSSDPDFSMDRLVETIQLDPGITVQVLQVCNSPYYGLRQKVSSLQQALALLGVKSVVDIVLSSEVVSFYKVSQDGYALTRGELWRHSMTTALLARRIGESQHFEDVSTLFTAALLHDVGKLVLSEHVGDRFEQIVDMMEADEKTFVEVERGVLGVDHALLGGLIARHWNFPDPIVRAIALHHDPERARKDSELTRLVALANLVTLTMGIGAGLYGLAAPVSPGMLENLGMNRKALDSLLLDVKDIVDQADELLSMAG